MQPRDKRQVLLGSALPAYSYGWPTAAYGSYGYGWPSYGYGYAAGVAAAPAVHVIGKREAKAEEAPRDKRQVRPGFSVLYSASQVSLRH